MDRVVPLLNDDELPPSGKDPQGLLENVNEAYDYLVSQKLDRLSLPDENGYRVANLVRDHFQANLWRILELIETMVQNKRAGHHLAVIILARTVIENIASICAFKKKLAALLDEIDPETVSEEVHKLARESALATRSKFLIEKLGPEVRTTSAVTQIEKLDKKYPGLFKAYEHLCEYAHPNIHGTRGWFVQHEKSTDTMFYSSTPPEHLRDRAMDEIYNVAALLNEIVAIHIFLEEKLGHLSQVGADQSPWQ